ncbi:Uncharacterised protein [Klebsiella pneumoniae]|uniref:DUF4222 domain-containing protein n=1 Tax=Klebsiella pneumoniae TaxID=573 RepID=A0A2X3I930_KLEPN|nr:Uncharacterised protein [Klebsiella pneumoniae]
MTIKNSGLAAGGRAHREIRPGDKWKDSRGEIVIIESYQFNRVTFYRKDITRPVFVRLTGWFVNLYLFLLHLSTMKAILRG